MGIQANVTTPSGTDNIKHVFHLYVIRVQNRDKFIKFMHQNEIGTAIHYPSPVHKQPAYNNLSGDLKETELIAGEIVTLPLYPGLSKADVSAVIKAVNNFEDNK